MVNSKDFEMSIHIYIRGHFPVEQDMEQPCARCYIQLQQFRFDIIYFKLLLPFGIVYLAVQLLKFYFAYTFPVVDNLLLVKISIDTIGSRTTLLSLVHDFGDLLSHFFSCNFFNLVGKGTIDKILRIQFCFTTVVS